jgi:hypothetical protein
MTFGVIAGMLVLLGAFQPVDDAARDAEVRDRVQYRTLFRQIRDLDREYERAVESAMGEARDSETGEASLASQADLLALRDKRDRLMNRLMLLSLRHGWEMPDFNTGERGEEGGAHDDEVREIFSASSNVLRARFAEEARAAARLVELPIVPLIVER